FARPGTGAPRGGVPCAERRGPRPVVLRVPLGELVAVQCDRGRAEADLVAIGGHLIVAEDAAQHAYRLAQRMARLALVAFAPQQSHEVLARAAAARAPGQVDEQSEVLAP